jgi:hypothetical protein
MRSGVLDYATMDGQCVCVWLPFHPQQALKLAWKQTNDFLANKKKKKATILAPWGFGRIVAWLSVLRDTGDPDRRGVVATAVFVLLDQVFSKAPDLPDCVE